MAEARNRATGSGLSYVAEQTDAQVSVRDDSGATAPLRLDGEPVAWLPAGGEIGRVAAGVFRHLTGITWPRPPLPEKLAEEVLRSRWRDGRLEVEGAEVQLWLNENAPGLAHDDLPDLSGAAAPPEPPSTLEELLAQPGRDAARRITVARGIYANHPWHADWLPATGELLSVMHTGPDAAEWTVARIIPNVPVADVLHLSVDPPTSLGHLGERLDQLATSGGPAGADGPTAWEDAS